MWVVISLFFSSAGNILLSDQQLLHFLETLHIGSSTLQSVRGSVPFSVLMELRIDIRTALEFRRFSGFKSRRFGFWAYNDHSPTWLAFIDRMEEQYARENIPENFPNGWYRGIDLTGQWDDLSLIHI